MINRIKHIDGLRGIAVLMVISFHLLNNSYMASDINQLSEFEKLLMKSTSFGWAGVNLFFVISGFLIGTILIKNKTADNYFRVFYFRRILRIMPLYYLFLLIYLFLERIFNDNTLWLFEKPIPIWHYFVFLQNFSFSSLGHFGPNSLTPTWSLAIEEQFYLLVPFLIYHLKTKKLLFVSLIFISIAPIFRAYTTNWYMEYNHLIGRLDAPFFGIILAVVFNENEKYMKIIKSKYTILSIFVLLISIYLLVSKSINHTLISFLFFYIILFLISLKNESSISLILESKFLLFVGQLSFFIYLFHQLINGLLFYSFGKSSTPNLNSVNDYLIEFSTLVVTVSLAFLSNRFFEGKIISFGKKFNYI